MKCHVNNEVPRIFYVEEISGFCEFSYKFSFDVFCA